MKRFLIGLLLLASLAACHAPTREARRMVRRAEQIADTQPDSALRLIDSVLHTSVNFSERERMEMAMLQADILFGDRGQEISPVMDDDFFDDRGNIYTSPELERAADYYASKKQYAHAAHAALYSGFVQQHYGEKEVAMSSFKEAKQYGELAGDSLTLARAEYKMGKMLYDDYTEREALSFFKASDSLFGCHYAERALALNMEAVSFIVLKQLDSAEMCLQKSLTYAERSMNNKAKRIILNNYSVLYRMQGRYGDAIDILRRLVETSLDETNLFVHQLNLAKTFLAANEMDSAALYFKSIEDFLSNSRIKPETIVSAYGALSQFAESQGNTPLALQYWKQRLYWHDEVRDSWEQNNVFAIQRKYDYGVLQNKMNQHLIRKQHVITLFGILAILGLVALAVSLIHLAKMRKTEAETKANLFHFMQQNQILAQKNEKQEQNQVYLTQKHKESEQAYELLLKEKTEQELLVAEYGEKFSVALKKEQNIMLRLHLFMENSGDEELLNKLEKTVFGKKTHMDAMMEVVDLLYPQLRQIVKQKNLSLDENEQMDVILSYFNISRQDEALLLHKTTDMVDKIRNRGRKKIQSASGATKLP